MEYGVQTLGEVLRRRDLIRDAGIADLRLRAHDALSDCRGAGEKRMRDLLGRQPADLAQRKRDLRVGHQRGMATGEDEAELVVFDDRLIACIAAHCWFVEALRESAQRCVEPRAAAESINRLEATDRHEPRSWVGGHTLTRPSLHGRSERLVHRFLGEIEVAEEADERSENAAGVVSIDALDRLTSPLRRVLDKQRTFPR